MAAKSDDMQCFTATGRPYVKKDHNDAMNNIMFGGEFTNGHGPANLLPFKFTDSSIINIAVLPPGTFGKSFDTDSLDSELPIKEEKKKGGFLRKLSTVSKSKKQEDFVMKGVARGDYLKFYAKDEQGKYIGTEDPAPDCILNGSDVAKYRGGL